jgi:hypothetical protein
VWPGAAERESRRHAPGRAAALTVFFQFLELRPKAEINNL